MSPQIGRCIIAGGGVGGLASALFLQRAGWAVAVIELSPSDRDREGHMGLGIWRTAVKCLERVGLTPQELSNAGKGVRYMLDSGYTTVRGQVLAKPGTALKEGDLLFLRRQELIQALQLALAPGTTIRYGQQLTSFDESPDKVVVTTSDGTHLEADLLVGADGMFSRVREQTLRARSKPSYRGYRVYRGVVDQHVQEFSFQTWGPSSRVASVPLKEGQVWFATVAGPEGMKHGDTPMAWKSFLSDRFKDWHEPIPALIRNTRPETILYDDAYAHTCFRGFSTNRVTLVGDAAHGVDPILAQGAGVAIEDAYELAVQVTRAHRAGRPLGSALKQYEELTAVRAEILTFVSDLAQTLGQMSSTKAISIRDSAFLLTPQVLKGPIFDSMIRLSLARSWSGAFSKELGYRPTDYETK